VTCTKPRRRGAVKCKVSFVASRSSRLLVARLMRGDDVYASATRRVRPGRAGSVPLRARRTIRPGRYVLVLSFVDTDGPATRVTQPVTVAGH
jgi:hypothetical protein